MGINPRCHLVPEVSAENIFLRSTASLRHPSPSHINQVSSGSPQRPHTSDHHRLQPGRDPGAQDPRQVQWQGVCQRKWLLSARCRRAVPGSISSPPSQAHMRGSWCVGSLHSETCRGKSCSGGYCPRLTQTGHPGKRGLTHTNGKLLLQQRSNCQGVFKAGIGGCSF